MFFGKLMARDNLKEVYENLMKDIDSFNESRKVNTESNELFWGACILYFLSSEESNKENIIENTYSKITSEKEGSFIPGKGKKSSFINGTLKICNFLKNKENFKDSTIFEIHRLGADDNAKTLSRNKLDGLEVLREYHFGETFIVYLYGTSIINKTIKEAYRKAAKSETISTFASWNPSDLYLVDLDEKNQIINTLEDLKGPLEGGRFEIAYLNSKLIDFYNKCFLVGISLKEIKKEVKFIKNPEERLGAPFYRYISVSDRNIGKISIKYSDFEPSGEALLKHTRRKKTPYVSIFFNLFRTKGRFNLRSFGTSYAIECIFKGADAIVGKYPTNLLLQILQQENNKITSLNTLPDNPIADSFISLYDKLKDEEKQKLLLELYKGCAKLSDDCAPHLDIFGSNKYYNLIK